MAKRHHKKHHRRRRVGALNPSSPLVMLGSVAAGFFADQFVGINSMLDGLLPGTVTTPASGTTPAVVTPTPTMNNVAMAGELGLGGYLMLSKGKSVTKTIAGGLIAGLGVRRLLKEMKVISGYQDTPVIGRRHHHVRGYQNTPVLGAVMPPALSGVPQALQGFRVNGYTPTGSGAKVMGAVDTETEYRNGSGYMR